ncbi:MAG TPA: PAS domain S-box protein [Kamptonema sp.]|nr:PAS domain S-box protein [Kamptonema sp.]
METRIFEQYLEASRQRLELMIQRVDKLPKPLGELWRQSEEFSSQQEQLLLESLEELSVALEELQVASEVLQQVNEDLVASRQEIETERLRYKDLFDFAPDGYLVTDSQGVIKEANLAGAALLKVQSDRLVGKPLTVFVAESERRNFRTQLNLLQRGETVKNWLVTLQPRKGEAFRVALTVTLIENSAGGLEGLRWRLFPLPTEETSGERTAAVEALEEIKDEFVSVKEAEQSAVALELAVARGEKQQRRDRLFRTSFEKAGVGIALLDRSGCAIESNQALQNILGYSRQELRQISLIKLTHPSDRKIDRELFEQLISGKGDRYQVNKRFLTKAGEIKQMAMMVFLVRDRNLGPLLTGVVVHEISEDSMLNCNSKPWFDPRLNKFY